MPTDCSSGQLTFQSFDGRKVVAAFDGGAITSNAGALRIFVCSALISAAGAAWAAPLPAPNTSAALPSSCAFQAVIWLG